MIFELIGLLHEPMQISFDYTIKSNEPQSLDTENKNWVIPLEINATANKNMDFCANYFIKTLGALSLSISEVENYKSINKQVFPVNIIYKGNQRTFYLRKESSLNALKTFVSHWEFYVRGFSIENGITKSQSKGKGQLHRFFNENDGEFSIDFLDSGQIAGTFSEKDIMTLEQIEKITGYLIKPIGISFPFKNGGFVVWEENGHGLVVAVSDIGQLNWNDAKQACSNLKLSGYNDWSLPSNIQLDAINTFLYVKGLGGFKHGFDDHGFVDRYWSSTEFPYPSTDNYAMTFNEMINSNKTLIGLSKENYFFVRPVRVF